MFNLKRKIGKSTTGWKLEEVKKRKRNVKYQKEGVVEKVQMS